MKNIWKLMSVCALAIGVTGFVACNDDETPTTGGGVELTAPENLDATPSYDKADLSWDVVEGAKSYKVFLTGGANPKTYNATKNSFTVTNLEEQKEYSWEVCALDADKKEGPRASSTFTTTKYVFSYLSLIGPYSGAGTPVADQTTPAWSGNMEQPINSQGTPVETAYYGLNMFDVQTQMGFDEEGITIYNDNGALFLVNGASGKYSWKLTPQGGSQFSALVILRMLYADGVDSADMLSVPWNQQALLQWDYKAKTLTFPTTVNNRPVGYVMWIMEANAPNWEFVSDRGRATDIYTDITLTLSGGGTRVNATRVDVESLPANHPFRSSAMEMFQGSAIPTGKVVR